MNRGPDNESTRDSGSVSVTGDFLPSPVNSYFPFVKITPLGIVFIILLFVGASCYVGGVWHANNSEIGSTALLGTITAIIGIAGFIFVFFPKLRYFENHLQLVEYNAGTQRESLHASNRANDLTGEGHGIQISQNAAVNESSERQNTISERGLRINQDLEEKQLTIETALVKLLGKPAIQPPEYSFKRNSTQQAQGAISDHIENFGSKQQPGFVLAVGPKAAGKTTLFKQLLGGKKGVIHIVANIDPKKEVNVDWLQTQILKKYQATSVSGEFEDLIRQLREKCKEEGCSLVIYADLNMLSKADYGERDAQSVGEVIGGFGRLITHDVEPLCPLIIETSISQISDAITRIHGNICKKVHVPRLNFEEFAISYALKYGNRFDAIIGSPKGTISVPSLGENVPNYSTALEDWYYRLGSNMRDLGEALEGLEESGGGRDVFMGDIRRNHKLELHSIRTITPDELNFLKKVAKAGPAGCGFDPDTDEDNVQVSLLKRGPKDTIIYLRGHKVSMWRMSHVYYLLGMGKKEKPADKKGESTMSIHEQIVEEMEEYGWVGIKQ